MKRSLSVKRLAGVVLPAVVWACARASSTPGVPPAPNPQSAGQRAGIAPADAKPDSLHVNYFQARVAPILAKCQPCHFHGGKMYAHLPFDEPQTIRRLGTRLFTRIHDRQEQEVIRAFLALPEDSVKIASQAAVSH